MGMEGMGRARVAAGAPSVNAWQTGLFTATGNTGNGDATETNPVVRSVRRHLKRKGP